MNTSYMDHCEEWNVAGYAPMEDWEDVVADDFNEETEFFTLFGDVLEGDC